MIYINSIILVGLEEIVILINKYHKFAVVKVEKIEEDYLTFKYKILNK